MGERLRAIRLWCGMTQSEVAGLAGVSTPYVSMVERGIRAVDRRSTISALAAALRVSETDLTGGSHLRSDPEQAAPHAGIPALRTVLLSSALSDSPVDRARPLAELLQIITKVELLRRSCDYSAVGQILPDLLDELHFYVSQPADEAVQRAALRGLVEACANASLMAMHLGYGDLAHVAALRAEEAAAVLGEPSEAGKATFLRICTAPQEIRSWERTLGTAERAADDLQAHVKDRETISVLGLLTLSAAMAAAVLQRRASVDHWLSESAALAGRVPDEMDGSWQSFCSSNVAIWRTSVAVERGESGGKIAELARAVDVGKLTSESRRAAFFVDVGRGLAREPKSRAGAVSWLRRAEDLAPQYVRNCPAARETVAYLLGRAVATAGGRGSGGSPPAWASCIDRGMCLMANSSGHRVLYVVGCGGYASGHLAEFVSFAQGEGWDVCVIATPQGTKFMDTAELAEAHRSSSAKRVQAGRRARRPAAC